MRIGSSVLTILIAVHFTPSVAGAIDHGNLSEASALELYEVAFLEQLKVAHHPAGEPASLCIGGDPPAVLLRRLSTAQRPVRGCREQQGLRWYALQLGANQPTEAAVVGWNSRDKTTRAFLAKRRNGHWIIVSHDVVTIS